MKAPQEFHGTSGEVTVPLSAASRDRSVGARPRRASSARKIVVGSTSATSPTWDVSRVATPLPGDPGEAIDVKQA
jgi:hypothetical protein